MPQRTLRIQLQRTAPHHLRLLALTALPLCWIAAGTWAEANDEPVNEDVSTERRRVALEFVRSIAENEDSPEQVDAVDILRWHGYLPTPAGEEINALGARDADTPLPDLELIAELEDLESARLAARRWSRTKIEPDERNGLLTSRQWLLGNTEIEPQMLVDLLAAIGIPADTEQLTKILGDERSTTSLRLSAAHALLRIERRQLRGLKPLDWTVVTLYAVGVLLVGFYFSRRAKTGSDYFLGGRNMRWWMVGLSLFATLLSTISYLAHPGEMIRNGPMFLCLTVGYPFVVGFVGWCIIPTIMKLNVTSAYEILEVRLGRGVRHLGSTFFLTLRLLWMAVILHATTTKVLLPILGWGDAAAPWVCAFLGGLTLIYTSMGGMRAVVLTDVVQTCILFAGAIGALVLISVSMGGVESWWPSGWLSHWQEPVVFFDSKARVTVMGAALAAFTWYVCTASSDQLAIQRYLSTRDASTARRALMISMAADALVMLFLGTLGLALLAYFSQHPHLVPDGPGLFENSDALFARYISVGLPVGVSGLVIAGLLAAAMSSLSSGINSSSSVITVDFLEPSSNASASGASAIRTSASRGETNPETADVARAHTARRVSAVVGVVAVLLSVLVRYVPGNLFEIAYKVVNLLVAPLAGLFFLALFVPWATPAGAFAGAFIGVFVAVSIAFWETIWQPLLHVEGLSFLWIMPLALAAELTVGALVSAVTHPRHRNE